MVKILKSKHRSEKEDIYNTLDEIDSKFLEINQELRKLKSEFVNDRDKYLIERLSKNAEWSANRTLLLKGRITGYELGNKLFMGKKYLQFYFRRKAPTPRNLRYIRLRETKYSGKKFRKFIERELGAKAQVGIVGGKMIIVSILIPENKKNLIVYE